MEGEKNDMSFNQHGENDGANVLIGAGNVRDTFSPETGQQRDSYLSATYQCPPILDQHLEIQEQGKTQMEELFK